MRNRTALKIAKIGLQEIRLLLHKGKTEQALEVAEALRNLPLKETNRDQTNATRQGITHYLNRYEDRKKLSHWQEIETYDDSYGITEPPERDEDSRPKVIARYIVNA